MIGGLKREIRTREEPGMFILQKRGWMEEGMGKTHHWGLLCEGILSEEELNLHCRAPKGRTMPCTRATGRHSIKATVK